MISRTIYLVSQRDLAELGKCINIAIFEVLKKVYKIDAGKIHYDASEAREKAAWFFHKPIVPLTEPEKEEIVTQALQEAAGNDAEMVKKIRTGEFSFLLLHQDMMDRVRRLATERAK